jgi:hypothetical protein
MRILSLPCHIPLIPVTAAALATVVLLVGCGRSEPPEFQAPGYSLSAGPVRSLPSDSILHDIRDAWEDEAGLIWILSGYAPYLHVYGEDGRHVRSFGARGEGPGELRAPWYLVGASRRPGTVEVWDIGARRINRYDTAGSFLAEVHLERMSGPVMSGYREGEFGEPLRLVAMDDGYALEVYREQFSTSWHLWRGVLLKLDSLGTVMDTISVHARLADSLPSKGPSVLGAGPLWTPCGADVAILQPEVKELLKLSQSGELLGRRTVDLPAVALTREDISRHVENQMDREAREEGIDRSSPGLVRFAQRVIVQVLASAPELAPPVRIRCDPADGVWVQTFSTRTDPRGYGPLWLRASWGGQGEEELDWVRFPDGFQPLHFGEKRIVGISTDSLGVQVPAWVPFPEELMRR